LGRETLE